MIARAPCLFALFFLLSCRESPPCTTPTHLVKQWVIHDVWEHQMDTVIIDTVKIDTLHHMERQIPAGYRREFDEFPASALNSPESNGFIRDTGSTSLLTDYDLTVTGFDTVSVGSQRIRILGFYGIRSGVRYRNRIPTWTTGVYMDDIGVISMATVTRELDTLSKPKITSLITLSRIDKRCGPTTVDSLLTVSIVTSDPVQHLQRQANERWPTEEMALRSAPPILGYRR